MLHSITADFLNFQRNKDFNLDWTDFDHRTAEKLWRIHRNDPMASQCRKFVLSFISNDVQFTQGDNPRPPKPSFQQIIRTHWLPFIENAYDSLFIMGVIPITFVRIRNEEHRYVPEVLERGSYRLQFAYVRDTNSYVYRVLTRKSKLINPKKSILKPKKAKTLFNLFDYDFSRGSSSYEGFKHAYPDMKHYYTSDVEDDWILDQSAIVMHGFGYDDINGQLNTPLMSVLPIQDMIDQYGKFMTFNQLKMLATPLFIEKNESNDQKADRDRNDTTSTANKRENIMRKREEQQKEDMDTLATLYQGDFQRLIFSMPGGVTEMTNKSAERATNAQTRMFGDVALPGRGIISVPDGWTLSNGQRAEILVGMKFFDLMVLGDEAKTSASGIPLDLIKNHGTHRSDSAVQSEFFQQTIKNLDKHFRRVLTLCYNAIYGEKDERDMVAARELEVFRTSDNLDETIGKLVTDEWQDQGGEILKRHRSGKLNTVIDLEDDVDASDDEEEEEEESSSQKSKKRSRDEKSKSSTNKLRDDTEEGEKSKNKKNAKKHLKSASGDSRIEVSLAVNSVSLIDFYLLLREAGAISDIELWTGLRTRAGMNIDDSTFKMLKKQKKADQEAMAPKGANGAKKPGASKSASKSKAKSGASTSSSKSSSGSSEGRGRPKDPHKAVEEKKKKSEHQTSSANQKREVSAHKTQLSNATKGKDNAQKSAK